MRCLLASRYSGGCLPLLRYALDAHRHPDARIEQSTVPGTDPHRLARALAASCAPSRHRPFFRCLLIYAPDEPGATDPARRAGIAAAILAHLGLAPPAFNHIRISHREKAALHEHLIICRRAVDGRLWQQPWRQGRRQAALCRHLTPGRWTSGDDPGFPPGPEGRGRTLVAAVQCSVVRAVAAAAPAGTDERWQRLHMELHRRGLALRVRSPALDGRSGYSIALLADGQRPTVSAWRASRLGFTGARQLHRLLEVPAPSAPVPEGAATAQRDDAAYRVAWPGHHAPSCDPPTASSPCGDPEREQRRCALWAWLSAFREAWPTRNPAAPGAHAPGPWRPRVAEAARDVWPGADPRVLPGGPTAPPPWLGWDAELPMCAAKLGFTGALALTRLHPAADGTIGRDGPTHQPVPGSWPW